MTKWCIAAMALGILIATGAAVILSPNPHLDFEVEATGRTVAAPSIKTVTLGGDKVYLALNQIRWTCRTDISVQIYDNDGLLITECDPTTFYLRDQQEDLNPFCQHRDLRYLDAEDIGKVVVSFLNVTIAEDI